MKIEITPIPFNNRLYIEEVKEEDKKVGTIVVPNFVKDRKDIPKFMRVKILNVSSNLSESLIGKEAMVETGFYEEVTIDGKIYTFCPISYVVCLIEANKI